LTEQDDNLPSLLRAGLLAAVLLLASGSATAVTLCSDYHSTINCLGGPRPRHSGIDFRGNPGTEVLSATRGTVAKKMFNECSGHGIAIKTDIVARRGNIEGPVYAFYWHVEPIAGLRVSQTVEPGDLIGKIIPLRRTRCYGTAEHVHYELRVGDTPGHDISPHQFWADGPRKLTCFENAASVPAGKAVVPVRCSR
jgi:murein DD-endopeptidase MepM/ murein hydrolase activator NlpD